MVRDGLSIYRVLTDVLETLKPDLILTQDQCDVCAVTLKDVEKAVCHLTHQPTEIISLRPYVLDDLPKTFHQIGKATGKEAQAEALHTEFWIRLNQINARAGTKLNYPKVLLLEWLDPPYVAGGWMPQLAVLAGGAPLVVSEPEKFQKLEWDEVEKIPADKILILPCGFTMERTLQDLEDDTLSRRLKSLAAYKTGQIYICDGNQFFNRPGPRLTESCEIMAAIFHPEQFPELVKKHSMTNYISWN